MPEQSKFLKYQDQNGDFLIDECEIDIPGPLEKVCLDCKPNPKAIVENWRFSIGEPFLNERLCLYQVGIETPYNSTGDTGDSDDSLKAKFEEFKSQAIDILLTEYDKEYTSENFLRLEKVIQYDLLEGFELDVRNGSRLQLLYSVPFENFEEIPNATDEDDEEEEEREPITVTYTSAQFVLKLLRVRKALNLYSRYVKYHKHIHEQNFIYTKSGKFFDLKRYGDSGFRRNSQMAQVFVQLDKFLKTKGYNIPGGGARSLFKDRVVKMTFSFDTEFKLKKLKIFTVACAEKPIVFKGRKIAALNRKSVFKDKTAMAYLAQLNEMERDLTSRVPKKFTEFLIDYTYPEISLVGSARVGADLPETSCVAQAIAENANSLGEDIFDEVLSLGDAIAGLFNEKMCKQLEEVREEQNQRGERHRPVEELRLGLKKRKETKEEAKAEKKRKKEERANKTPEQKKEERKEKVKNSGRMLKAAAFEKAYRDLNASPNVYTRLCADTLLSNTKFGDKLEARDMWDGGFDQLGFCGLSDFLVSGIACLFGSLTLQDALRIMITQALEAMGIENFGILFFGLPPEEQAQLDALVKRQLAESINRGQTRRPPEFATVGEVASGEQRQAGGLDSTRAAIGSSPNPLNNINFVRPFENEETIERERNARVPGSYETTSISSANKEATGQRTGQRRNLGTVYPTTSITTKEGTQKNIPDLSGRQTPGADAITGFAEDAENIFSDNQIMDAYIKALIEVYSGRLLDLVDRLNRFPGAEIVAKVLATVQCPAPPLFDFSGLDFLKDLALPFCRNKNAIKAPYIPYLRSEWTELEPLKILKEAILEALEAKAIELLFKLILKVCQLLGNAVCKALETTGEIIGDLPQLIGGNSAFRDIVRDAICGPDADDEKINGAIKDLFSVVGGAGANLANEDRVLEFTEAVASSTTRNEIIEASLGNASPQFLTIVDTIIEYEFDDLRETFSNEQDISSFYSNFGSLLPENFKDTLRAIVAPTIDDDAQVPANPTLCATPEQIEEFCSIRAQILEGRASPSQIEALCRRPTEDFETLAGVLQNGIPATLLDNIGPIVSSPGCNDGVVPREAEEDVATTTAALSKNLESLKVAFAYDMLGNGPGKKNWGFVNMVLSDTMGRPYTAHNRKNNADPGALQYVDFYFPNSAEDADGTLNYARDGAQRGAYPKYIAEWQSIYFSQNKDNFITVDLNNEFRGKKKKFIPFKEIDSGTTNGIESKNLTRLPDFGYNYKINTIENDNKDGIKLTFRPRKDKADLVMKWRDNAGGTAGSLAPLTSPAIPELPSFGNDGTFILGYNFKFYFSDFAGPKNRADDNVRFSITRVTDLNKFLFSSALKAASADFGGPADDFDEDDFDIEQKPTKLIYSKEHEFISYDRGLEGIVEDGFASSDYPQFREALQEVTSSTSPVQALISDILGISKSEAKTYWNSTVTSLLDGMGSKIFDLENKSFRYGARFDDISPEDADYGVIRNGKFVDYSDAKNSEGDNLTNSDAELGLSRDQFKNKDKPENARIVYLDPAAHGGSYTNPKYYIKPVNNSGWLGLVNVMFPELSPCKPYRTDLIDFGDIDSIISNTYSGSPDDRRLRSDPDCVTEKPFDRILDRSGKAGIKGMIIAACRIYVSIYFMKALATFSKYKPDFNTNYSNLFASFIVEEMEVGMKDSQGGFAELFNPFKDEEFWYAFLEQSVQTYHDQVESGEIEDVPVNVQNALKKIAQVQREYKYPREKELKKKRSGGQREPFQTKRAYKETKNLEAVKSVEEHAKVILKEYVAEEVNFISNIFEENLKREGFIDKDDYVSNVYYNILSDFTNGTSLTLDREIKEEVVGIGEGGFTNGDEFALEEEGTPYVGYYHVRNDETGQPVFMVGEEHSSGPHATLVPFARKVKLNIGNVDANIGSSGGGSKPFTLKKYLKVNGAREDMSYIETIINSNDGQLNISQVYPGTLQHVYEPSADQEGQELVNGGTTEQSGRRIIGLTGELGIRYGIALFARTDSGEKEIANAEIDALDLPIAMLKPLEGDSKELLCLINKLVDDKNFKAFFSYCIPVNKLLSGIAIYNAYTFLPSIGEVVGDGKKRQITDGFGGKPGLVAPAGGGFDASIPGWYKFNQRPKFTPFSLTWDEWDRITLRRSNAIIKKLFKSYYYSRDFDDPRPDGEESKLAILKLKEQFSLAPGQRIMPWWKRRSSNPYNNDDELCDRKE